MTPLTTPAAMPPISAPLRPLEVDAAGEVCVWPEEDVEVVDIVVTKLTVDVDWVDKNCVRVVDVALVSVMVLATTLVDAPVEPGVVLLPAEGVFEMLPLIKTTRTAA